MNAYLLSHDTTQPVTFSWGSAQVSGSALPCRLGSLTDFFVSLQGIISVHNKPSLNLLQLPCQSCLLTTQQFTFPCVTPAPSLASRGDTSRQQLQRPQQRTPAQSRTLITSHRTGQTDKSRGLLLTLQLGRLQQPRLPLSGVVINITNKLSSLSIIS